MFLTAHITVCICLAELKGYFLTYLLTREQNDLGWNVQGQTDEGAKRPQILCGFNWKFLLWFLWFWA